MKRFSVIYLIILFGVSLSGTTYYVSNSGNDNNPGTEEYPFEHIQYAVTVSQNGDIITVMDGTYNERPYITNKSITLRSYSGNQENCIIDGGNMGTVIDVYHDNSSEMFVTISGFKIVNSMYSKGIFVHTSHTIYSSYLNTEISSNIINNCREGINFYKVSDCLAKDNIIINYIDIDYCWGICSDQSENIVLDGNYVSDFLTNVLYFFSNGKVINCTIELGALSTYGIRLYTDCEVDILSNLITMNDDNVAGTGIICTSTCSAKIINNTIIDSDPSSVLTSIGYDGSAEIVKFVNNIMWDLNYNLAVYSPYWFEVNYCCFNGTIPDGCQPDEDHNINTDPLFTADYHLTSTSLCIDAGDPDTNGINGDYMTDEDDRDPDGSRMDMGCYPFEHDYDTKYFNTGVHWVSFPRIGLTTNNNGDKDLVDVLDHEVYPWDDIEYINIYYGVDNPPALFYNASLPTPWQIGPYYARSSNLYKIEVLPSDERTLIIDGERLSETYTYLVTDPLPAYEENWLGYWLPESRNIVDAFGDFWEYVEEVWSEDWYYNKNSNNRGIGEPEPVSGSTENKTLEYGKGYIVKFERTDQIDYFHWTSSNTTEEPKKKADSENFTYTEKPDYEVIDIVDIPENVVEIGVFEEDTCIGAVVVENSSEQILVYSDDLNRDQTPFSFEIITSNRGMNQPIDNYLVFNEDSGEFENGLVISGRQESSIIKFENIDDPGNNITPVIEKVQLHDNYPNPFNPETNISFSMPSEQKVQLTIYNLKGQKVRQLVNGVFASGKHSVVWNGKDDNGKQVCSGLYFYKLKTDNKEISKKMLLLK